MRSASAGEAASSLSSLHPDLILSCRGLVTDPLFALEIVKDSAMMQQQRSPSYSACSVRFDGDGGVGLFFIIISFTNGMYVTVIRKIVTVVCVECLHS
jgi:hypothetical protein